MRFLALCLTSLFLVSCASGVNKEISLHKKQVGRVHSKNVMLEKMRAALDKSTQLTEEQKESFMKIHDKILGKAHEINQDIRKLKVVLFQSLLQSKYNKKKVDHVVSKIKKLYNKKLDLMINGFYDVKDILGVKMNEFYQSEQWMKEHFDYNEKDPYLHQQPYPDDMYQN